jgi:hypothetical protein
MHPPILQDYRAAIATGRDKLGSINLGRLFRTLATLLLTFHAFMSSAGYGLNRSTGKWDGVAEASHRSQSFESKIAGIKSLIGLSPMVSQLVLIYFKLFTIAKADSRAEPE